MALKAPPWSPSLPLAAAANPNPRAAWASLAWPADAAATAATIDALVPTPPPPPYPPPVLTVHPTALKSRVETQIPIRLTLSRLPDGARRLRLPAHAIAKPKFLAKPGLPPTPDILHLRATLVCTSAMQDPAALQRALARARRREPALAAAAPLGDEDNSDKPLDGGDVRICSGCIQRERKRASRKKRRKPDEDARFQRDEERRVIVFNTPEIKDWTEPAATPAATATPSPDSRRSSAATAAAAAPEPAVPSGAMQVELPMRIACYCRHHNEKLGFQ
jgi:hypothetical protein